MILSQDEHRTVSAVLASPTIRQAADALELSPPTVSRRMRRLYRQIPGLDFAVWIVQGVQRQQCAGQPSTTLQ